MPVRLVARLAEVVAVINLLDNNSQAKQPINLVKSEIFGAKAHFFAIISHHFLPGQHARQVSWLAAQHFVDEIIIRLHPVGQRISQIHQRIAYRRHFPIQNPDHPHRVFRIQHDIIKTEIVVDEAGVFSFAGILAASQSMTERPEGTFQVLAFR